jgi:Phasin protein
METRGKRTRRIAAPPEGLAVQRVVSPSEIAAVPPVAAETVIQAHPLETAEPNPSSAPPEQDVVVQRVSSPVPAINAPHGERTDFGSESFAAIEEFRAATTRGFDALSEELAGLARCGMDTAARTAIDMLAVKTLSDAIAVNSCFARASFDNWLESSAKLSELGMKLVVESTRPFLARLSKNWSFAPFNAG